MSAVLPILRPGDSVTFDGGDHVVVAFSSTSVRLRSAADGTESVVLLSYLMASPGFALLGSPATVAAEPLGLLEQLPPQAVARAREWERHLVEVITGVPMGAAPGTAARPQYAPAATTQRERDAAKAAELTAAGHRVSARTVERLRASYVRQGLLGLVDQRSARRAAPTGRADPRVVEVVSQLIAEQTAASTGTRSRLYRLAQERLRQEHGHEVALPPTSTFYRLVAALSTGRHTFGSAVTRRQSANRPEGTFTKTSAMRPGEQVQIDSTPLDVMVVLDDGVIGRPDLTIAVDVATRTICAAVLRPAGSKAVDASLMLARTLVPEPMRPGWAQALRMSASRLPHARLTSIDARMQAAAAKPVILPDTVVIDRGRVFVSENFLRSCERLGISVQLARPRTPTDKSVVERTFHSINTLFVQHLPGYTGANVQQRGAGIEQQATWTIPDLQDLLDEWIVAGWQSRPHQALRDPHAPKRCVSPNERYAALVAAAGYLPLTLTGRDYLELLPIEWRAIGDGGIQIDYRTYDHPDLGPLRRQDSGISAQGGRWEVHYDPYDVTRVFVRAGDRWITVPWTHLPMLSAPFADFTWRHARKLAAAARANDTDETVVTRVLADLLDRAARRPVADKPTARILARTKAAARSPLGTSASETAPESQQADPPGTANVVPFAVFDARKESERWS